jgi:hypothetical protein
MGKRKKVELNLNEDIVKEAVEIWKIDHSIKEDVSISTPRILDDVLNKWIRIKKVCDYRLFELLE